MAVAIQSARPTITLDGRDNQALVGGLRGLTIVENTAGLYRCEAMFGNWGDYNGGRDFLYFDRRTLDFARPFKVKVDDDVIFDGRITALEAQFPEGDSPSITVLAEDRLQDLRMTRRTRTFADAADGDVFRQIANDHGLTPDIDLPNAQHRVIAQVNQSDLAFLRERARAIDAEVWVTGSTLHAKSRANRGGAALELNYHDTLLEFSALADLANQRTSVAVTGWDVAGKQAIRHEATDSILSGELNGDVSGVSILQSKFGARKEQLAHPVPLTAGDAQTEAEAFFRMSARRFVIGRGRARINAKLRVGVTVELKRLGALFSGKYYVTEVQHLFDGAGFNTEFTCERAGIGRP